MKASIRLETKKVKLHCCRYFTPCDVVWVEFVEFLQSDQF